MKPLSATSVAMIAAGVLVLTAAAVAGLLWWVNTSGLAGTDLTNARLESVKVSLGVAVGSGGVFALYLAWRRQRSNEADHVQRERALGDTRQDALERRVTELYTKAADQLGSDKAPVRLAGLYALERLAQDNETHRQTIVDLLCAYLRMPFDVPERTLQSVDDERDHTDVDDSDTNILMKRLTVSDGETKRVQELQVRLTAQRILTNHLRPELDEDGQITNAKYWLLMDLDLTDAVLVDFNLRLCYSGTALFEGAKFVGHALFDLSKFAGEAVFDRAVFTMVAGFIGARFDEPVSFERTDFRGDTTFEHSGFHGHTVFRQVKFAGDARFDGAEFTHSVEFDGTEFAAVVSFDEAKLADETSFKNVRFADQVPAVIQPLIEASISRPGEDVDE